VNAVKKFKFYLFILFLFSATAFGLFYFAITTRTEGQYFDSDKVPIYYTIEGNGETIILLHSFAVNADLSYRRPGITQELSKNFRVIAFDIRGHGLSGKPHDPDKYGLEMGYDLIRLMDHLNIDKAHIVGFSLGGFIALKLAPRYQDRFESLSLICSGWEKPDESKFTDVVARAKKELNSGKGIDPIFEQLVPDNHISTPSHRFWLHFMTRFLNDRFALIAMLDRLQDLYLTEQEIKSIHIPVLSIVGDKDPFLKGAEALDSVALNHKLHIVKNAGRVKIPLRDETTKEIINFIKDNNNSQAGLNNFNDNQYK